MLLPYFRYIMFTRFESVVELAPNIDREKDTQTKKAQAFTFFSINWEVSVLKTSLLIPQEVWVYKVTSDIIDIAGDQDVHPASNIVNFLPCWVLLWIKVQVNSTKVVIIFFFSMGVSGILFLLLFTLRATISLTSLLSLQFFTSLYMCSSHIDFTSF